MGKQKKYWDEEKELVSVQKNKKDNIVVKHVSKDDDHFIDIRTYSKNDDDEYIPTPKGAVTPMSEIPKIIQAMQASYDEWEKDNTPE